MCSIHRFDRALPTANYSSAGTESSIGGECVELRASQSALPPGTCRTLAQPSLGPGGASVASHSLLCLVGLCGGARLLRELPLNQHVTGCCCYTPRAAQRLRPSDSAARPGGAVVLRLGRLASTRGSVQLLSLRSARAWRPSASSAVERKLLLCQLRERVVGHWTLPSLAPPIEPLRFLHVADTWW